MAGLTFTAYYTRKWIKWGAIGLVVYTILHIFVVVSYRWIVELMTPEAPPPAAAFGIIAYPSFPQQDGSLQFQYRLETATGGLPTTFPDRALVFKNASYSPNFADLNRAQNRASKVGFDQEPTEVEPSRYRWRKITGVSGLLEMHIFSDELDMVLDWPRNESRYIGTYRQPISNRQAFDVVRRFMQGIDIWSSDWPNGSYAVLYHEYVSGNLIEVDRLSRADFLQVNLMPSRLAENFNYVTADPKRPVVWGLVARNNKELVEMHYHYQGILRNNNSEYPLAPISVAWQKLVAGEGHIASIGQNNPDVPVVIRHFELAYYLSDKETSHTQPVYVMKGDNGFLAYIPALDPSYLQAATQ